MNSSLDENLISFVMKVSKWSRDGEKNSVHPFNLVNILRCASGFGLREWSEYHPLGEASHQSKTQENVNLVEHIFKVILIIKRKLQATLFVFSSIADLWQRMALLCDQCGISRGDAFRRRRDLRALPGDRWLAHPCLQDWYTADCWSLLARSVSVFEGCKNNTHRPTHSLTAALTFCKNAFKISPKKAGRSSGGLMLLCYVVRHVYCCCLTCSSLVCSPL